MIHLRKIFGHQTKDFLQSKYSLTRSPSCASATIIGRTFCNDNSSKLPTVTPKKWITLKIDRSSLLNYDIDDNLISPSASVPSLLDSNGNKITTSTDSALKAVYIPKEESSELGKELKSYISLRGPITLHDYVSQAAMHFVHGYYQSKSSKIGSKGDFVTSPEISPLFGDVIATWCVSAWKSLGCPPRIRLVELGPGYGTLMKDILRCAKSFPAFKQALSVEMVELSDFMRKIQKETLECQNIVDCAAVDSSNAASDSTSADTLSNSTAEAAETNATKTTIHKTNTDEHTDSCISNDGVSIRWYSHLKKIPIDASIPVLFVGQEFLDVFPVHQLVNRSSTAGHIARPAAATRTASSSSGSGSSSTSSGWSEKLVDIDSSATSPYHFRMVLSPGDTPATRVYVPYYQNLIQPPQQPLQGDQATVAECDPVVPPTNATHTTDTDTINASNVTMNNLTSIEISPLAIATCEYLGQVIAQCSGAALLIDYGENCTQHDTLRGYKQHKQVNILTEPGTVDITADVDFFLCQQILKQNPKLKVLPVLTQQEFLMKMGIIDRCEQLLEKDEVNEEEAEEMVQGVKKLIGPEKDDMGTRYKAMVFMNKELAIDILECRVSE